MADLHPYCKSYIRDLRQNRGICFSIEQADTAILAPSFGSLSYYESVSFCLFCSVCSSGVNPHLFSSWYAGCKFIFRVRIKNSRSSDLLNTENAQGETSFYIPPFLTRNLKKVLEMQPLKTGF